MTFNGTTIGGQCEFFQEWEAVIGQFDSIVLNAGAHLHANVDGLYATLLRHARHAIEPHVQRRNATVFFRTTVPGHGDCMTQTRPFASVDEAEAYVRGHPWYDGAHFSGLDAIARRIFGSQILDVYAPTLMRPDHHRSERDCLHYCLPGPSTVWVDMLWSRWVDAGVFREVPARVAE